MSVIPTPAARQDPPGAGDQRCKEAGRQAIRRLASAVRIGRSYQTDNRVFGQQLEGLFSTLIPLIEESGEAVLVALQEDLYLNGVRIPVKAGDLKFHHAVLGEFRMRDIAGLRIQKGIDEAELTRFLRLFLQPDVYRGSDLLGACLAQGVDHVIPAIHAAADAPDEGFDYDAPAPWDGEGFATAGPGAGGRGGGHGGAEPGRVGGPGGGATRGEARKRCAQALLGTQSLLAATALREGVELRHGKRVVQPLIDDAFAGEPVVVGLSSLTPEDDYTSAHAVDVCRIAVTMGRLLDLDRRALADLGVAALLHDVGKSAVADRIQNRHESFTPEEQAAAERHPLEGAKLIARSTTLNETTLRCMRVALEHHLLPDGSGYPAVSGRWPQSVLSRLVAVADGYVSLLGHRSERGLHTTPYEALGMMLGSLRKRFDPAMLWALVSSVGFYPPGQLVMLDDGAIAEVVASNRKDLARPHVRVVIDGSGVRPNAETPVLHRPLPPTLSVRRALKASEYPIGPGTGTAVGS